MKRWHQYVTAAAGIVLFAVVLSTTVARPVSAQADQPTHQAILAAISSLGTAVQSALGNIQSSLDALTAPDQANVRVTPPLSIAAGGTAACVVVNVADSPRTVTRQLLNAAGQQLTETTEVMTAGGTVGSVFFNPGSPYCKFTVRDGSRTDIRAVIQSNDGRLLSAE